MDSQLSSENISSEAVALFESNGLTIHHNPKNRFAVVTLYYWADPAKRGAEWEEEARAGMTEAQWRKEYMIDYEAQFGEKVFPQISTHKQFIVCKPIEFPEKQKFFGGLDYGSRNPSSFHVYTKHDGVVYSVWELYEPCKNLHEFVQKMQQCPYYKQLTHIAADPHMWDNRAYRSDGSLISVAIQFYEAGIKLLVKGNQDEQGWVAAVRQHWADPTKPTFKIFECCPNQVREFTGAVYEDYNNKAAITADYRETMVDVDNHAMDDCKYAFNSSPALLQRLEQKPFKFPIMVNKWLK